VFLLLQLSHSRTTCSDEVTRGRMSLKATTDGCKGLKSRNGGFEGLSKLSQGIEGGRAEEVGCRKLLVRSRDRRVPDRRLQDNKTMQVAGMRRGDERQVTTPEATK
jgi:hypothetical protein